MKIPHPGRSDFVLGMSLAEIILLLLFAFFISMAISSDSVSDKYRKLRRSVLEERLQEADEKITVLSKALTRTEEERDRLKRMIEYLREMTGINGATPDEILKDIEELRRGAAQCADSNTAIKVRAINGHVRVKLVSVDESLAAHLDQYGVVVRAGDILGTGSRLDSFLAAVWKYEQKKDCRYDYDADYKTAADYHAVRVKIERYFYPAVLRQVSE